RLLFAAHRDRDTRGAVPEPRLLLDRAALREDLDLAIDLVLERALHVPERVDVLGFGLRPERRVGRRTDRHVGVAAKASLLHVAVSDADRHEDLADPAEGCRREFG